MKKIILAGLIFDTNLGNPAMYKATKGMLQNYSFPSKIDTIDLYGRKSFILNFLIKVGKKFNINLE